jgi:hypothetical protein
MHAAKKILFTGLAGLAILAAGQSAVAQFGNSTQVEKFAVHDQNSISAISYSVIDQILEAFVIEERGRSVVRYSVMKGAGQRAIESVVSGFENIPPAKLNRDEQLAFWLNLRTLMVLHSTSAAYPSADPKLLLKPNSGFLNTPLITISEEDLSINDVDNILLTHWKDEPNLVFGLFVPTQGSPDFPVKAFSGASVKQDLEALGRKFVNRKDVVKASKGKVTIAQFLVDYQEHFGGEAGLVSHAKSLASPKLAAKWSQTARLQPKANWRLNERKERSLAAGRGRGGFGADVGGGLAGGSGFSGGGS